jgi:hypothetical protein
MKKLFKNELEWMRRAPSGRGTKSNYRQDKFFEIQDKYNDKKQLIYNESISLDISVQERRL